MGLNLGVRERWLAAAIAVVLVVGLVAVPFAGSDGAGSVLAGGDPATGSTTTAGGADPEGAVEAGAGAGQASAPEVGGQPAAAEETPPAAPGPTAEGPTLPFAPPRDGTYQMQGQSEFNSGGTKQSEPMSSSITIETTERTPDHIRQRRDSDGSGGGGGQSFTADGDTIWRPDGVVSSASPQMGGDQGFEMSCTPSEQSELQFPLSPGASWHNEADCTMSGQAEGEMHVESTTVVVGKTTVEVAGQTLEVWHMETDSTNSGTFRYDGRSQDMSGESHMTSYLAESVGMVVKMTGTMTQRTEAFSFDSSFETELVSLTPS